MVTKKSVSTTRIVQCVRLYRKTGTAVFYIHGNGSSSFFWEETMQHLPEGYKGIAPDLRGYGETEDKLIDATQGMADWVADFKALREALSIERYHIVGHSLGGAFLFALLGDEGERVLSATLVAPGSPFGFGGTKDVKGTPNYEDFAGSGGGIVNPEFARLMGENDRSKDNPQASPRVVMNSFYWKPPFIPEREEEYLTSLLSQKTGDTKYPGDFVSSMNFPFVAPGKYGPINSVSPKYVNSSVQQFIHMDHKPPILWIRGADDQIVSDQSMFDFGTLGKLGLIPDYPGEDIYPPQPMVSQTRHVLDQYQKNGGSYTEEVFEDCGHTPFVEKPELFQRLFHSFLLKHNG